MENSFNITRCQQIGCNKVSDVVVNSTLTGPAALVSRSWCPGMA